MTGNVYLVGFMGCGKSTIGPILAELLNFRFVDMDVELEKRFGRTIPEVFAEYGQDAFRREESYLLRVLSKKNGLVIATGGGIVERAEHLRVTRETGFPVYLALPFKKCIERLDDDERAKRPLLADLAQAERIYNHRVKLYEFFGPKVQAGGLTPKAAAEAALRAILDLDGFEVDHGGRQCPVTPCFNAEVELAKAVKGRRIALLTDDRVDALHLNRFRPFPTGSIEMVVPSGEGSKTLKTASRIYDRLLEAGFNRDDTLAAIGGGVITDLGAFVASTYKRGMRLILVSTTLLGCVDAAVGGKAAVNHGGAKNSVGSFSAPEKVILDFAAFRTLTRRHRLDGLAETYKTGLIASDHLAEFVEARLKSLVAGNMLDLAHAAVSAARIKASVVSSDFRESGLRRILNFGHTYGHGVEGASRLKIGHGPATALGMIAAVEMSFNRGLISTEERDRIQPVLSALIPPRVRVPPFDDILAVMRLDKKIRMGRLVFVLLRGIGDAVCVDDVDTAEIRKGDEAVRTLFGARLG
jgi:3-dehydroquinate synthetase/shikimate kinase